MLYVCHMTALYILKVGGLYIRVCRTLSECSSSALQGHGVPFSFWNVKWTGISKMWQKREIPEHQIHCFRSYQVSKLYRWHRNVDKVDLECNMAVSELCREMYILWYGSKMKPLREGTHQFSVQNLI